jgi:hypothetical protein
VDEKINILLVDDLPGKLLTYEAMLDDSVRTSSRLTLESKPSNTF